MSEKYNEYLREHKKGVSDAYNWMLLNIPEVFEDDDIKAKVEHQCNFAHDASKENTDEYEAYDAYLYGSKSFQVVQDFNYAWLNHIHRNPHHWQHWILLNDNPDEGEIILDMPDSYIIEMVCDWWSFSWKTGKLFEIFDWYDKHKDYIKLSELTRNKVEAILELIKEQLEEDRDGDQE